MTSRGLTAAKADGSPLAQACGAPADCGDYETRTGGLPGAGILS